MTLALIFIPLSARQVKENPDISKMLDIFKIHDIGNFSLRVSNYGFLGSGDDVVPQYPSLEFPKGSGIDFLYLGALWFGAARQRRNEYGEILYWQDPEHEETGTTNMGFGRVIDTLCTVGFDGDADYYEMLPAYNPLEANFIGQLYYEYNVFDRSLKYYDYQGVINIDDDEDGLIDEDPFGMLGFPYDSDSIFCFTRPYDNDGDGFEDEDGGYYGKENILSYFYDYSPFGTPGNRKWGSSSGIHTPLNIAVKQESFCWTGHMINQLALFKTTIYNMNEQDTLFDYSLGYYFDCDIGPQDWVIIYSDDVSSYDLDHEFPYSYDHDGDGGLTEGYVAAKIFSPQIYANYACWTWEPGDGPDDKERYWLMTHNEDSIDPQKWISLREFPNTQINNPCDTRFLYAYYGDMNGYVAPTDSSLNIAPGDSAVIYSAIFLGNTYDELIEIADILQQFYEANFDLSFLQNYYPTLIFSEYIEGSSQNKALEIYNGTYADVDLANYRIAQSVNGNGWEYWHDFPSGATLSYGDVWVITTNQADTTLLNVADEILSYPSVVHFDGNDARGLEKTTDGGQTWELIDVIGLPDEDPGDGWDVAGIPDATKDHTLVRKDSVFKGNIDWTASAGTNSDNSEWIVYPEDTFEYLGFHAEGGIPPTTFVSTTQGTIDSCRVGAAINFELYALPFVEYYKYRLVYYEKTTADSMIIEWDEDVVLDSTEWHSTEEYENPDEVLLMAYYPDGNPYGKPYLLVNDFNEVTQIQVKAVNYAGMEDPDYASMTFFVRGHFTPETRPFMSSWELGEDPQMDILPHIYVLGEYTYLTYAINEEIPYEIVSSEYHWANQFYMDINGVLSAIWSDDIEVYMNWEYYGEYIYDPRTGTKQLAEWTFYYDENLEEYQQYFCDIEYMEIQLDGSADGLPPIGTIIIDSTSGEEWMRIPIYEEQSCILSDILSGQHLLKIRAIDLQGHIGPTPEILEFELCERIEADEKEGVLLVDDTGNQPIFAYEDSVDIFYNNLLLDCSEDIVTFDLRDNPPLDSTGTPIYIRNKELRHDNLAPYFAPSDIQDYKLIIWHSNNPKKFYYDITQIHLIHHYDLLSFYLDSGGNLVFSGCAKIWDTNIARTNFLQDYAGLSESSSILNDIVESNGWYWGNPSPTNSMFTGTNGVVDFSNIDSLRLNLHLLNWSDLNPNLYNYFPEYFPFNSYLGAIGNITFLELENGEPIFTCIPSSLPEHQIFAGACVGSKYRKEPGVTGNTYILGFPLYYIQLDDARLFINKVFDEIDSLWSIDDEGQLSYVSNVLFQNYPNPMRSSTTISFSLHRKGTENAEIKIYNIKGQLVTQLPIVNSQLNWEQLSIEWDGTDKNNKFVSSGIYFYRLETENYQSSVKKLLLLR